MLDEYKVELKNMKADSVEYEYQLNNQFFTDLDVTDIRKGNLNVSVAVTKTAGVFKFVFNITGVVMVNCDRCLDEMEQPIESVDTLKVKLGEEYSELDDMVVVPEEEGSINIAWYLYEFIALNIPLKHVHADGECNPIMASKLNQHICVADDDELEETDNNKEGEIKMDPRWNELKKILNK